jgi:hypothetical protein
MSGNDLLWRQLSLVRGLELRRCVFTPGKRAWGILRVEVLPASTCPFCLALAILGSIYIQSRTQDAVSENPRTKGQPMLTRPHHIFLQAIFNQVLRSQASAITCE